MDEYKITVKLNLHTGGEIGNVQVISPLTEFLGNKKEAERYVKICIDQALRSCIDRLMLLGADAITAKKDKK